MSDVESLWIGDGPAGAIDLTINLDVDGPLGLDYQLTGLTRQRTPANAYKPPSPPPEGFTRNVAEDDVVVCPNCDMELGTGDETKQQIWVVKQCGHVRDTPELRLAQPSSNLDRRYIVATVPRTDRCRRRKRTLRKPSLSLNARYSVAGSPLVRPSQCSRFIYNDAAYHLWRLHNNSM